jgi:flagella basal body P-ring formation protein FlgA
MKQTLEDGQPAEAAAVTLSYLVKIKQPELVALKPIAKGEKIGPLNSGLAEKDATFQAEDGFSNTESAYGLSARRPIQADAVILAGMVELPVLVKRGDMVRLQARSGAVNVETSAKALRDGKKGDSIPVQVEATKKQINAVVVDERTVQAGAP